ncbi:MAG TPA: thioesterase family protein [Pseudomonadota bacterium]|nr:acyl-CoA thioesterase [Rhodanobacteraceae bacterium]MBP9154923.1 acyl-CoA thioesterase [Xanthomonadales bacterium]HQW81738.1 thioesterase family protein [Pseudomonadota bacterium]
MSADATPAKRLVRAPVSVRWGDMDAYNHVNNSVYATYVEEARLQWFRSLDPGWMNTDAAPILAALNTNFRKPIEWPAEIVVELYAGRAGRSSFTASFRIIDRDHAEVVYAEGDSVLVWINPNTGKSIELPAHVRAALV